MNPEQNLQEQEPKEVEQKKNVLHTVTPLSKYLAMTLFVGMPFVGGWIGYMYSPEKIVEVERVVVVEVHSDQLYENKEVLNPTNKSGVLSLKVGDTLGNMRVVSVEPYRDYSCIDERCTDKVPEPISNENIKIYLEGEGTFIGRLSAPTEDSIAMWIGPDYSITDIATSSLASFLPSEFDVKSLWFGVSNPEFLEGVDVKNGDLVEVTVDSYIYVSYPSEVWSSAVVSSIEKINRTNNSELALLNPVRDNAYMEYDVENGLITGEWQAQYGPDIHGGPSYNFLPDISYKDNLLRGDDNRIFLFSIVGDEQIMKRLFGVDLEVLSKIGENCVYKGGRAEIKISRYYALKAEIGATDLGRIVEVVDFTPYEMKECW